MRPDYTCLHSKIDRTPGANTLTLRIVWINDSASKAVGDFTLSMHAGWHNPETSVSPHSLTMSEMWIFGQLSMIVTKPLISTGFVMYAFACK